MLSENCSYSKLFWSALFSPWSSIFPYPVRLRENVGRNNSECHHFLRSDYEGVDFPKKDSLQKPVGGKMNLSHLMRIFLTAELSGKLMLNNFTEIK